VVRRPEGARYDDEFQGATSGIAKLWGGPTCTHYGENLWLSGQLLWETSADIWIVRLTKSGW